MEALKCLIATAACLSALGCSSQPKVVVQIEKEILLQSSASWDGTPYKAYPSGPPELTLLRLKIPANTQLPWHSHPMPNAAYILSGELIVEARKGGHALTLTQGQTLAEGGGDSPSRQNREHTGGTAGLLRRQRGHATLPATLIKPHH